MGTISTNVLILLNVCMCVCVYFLLGRVSTDVRKYAQALIQHSDVDLRSGIDGFRVCYFKINML